MTPKQSNQRKLLTSFIVLCVVAILVVGVDVTKHKAASPAAVATVTKSQPAASSASSSYKSGTYMATGKYSSPGGTQTLAVTLTLSGNTVSDASVTPSAKDGVAQIYQSYFTMNYKTQVVGKDVNTIKLSRVSGSSLTSKGFNQALEQIKKQAQA